MRVITQLVDPNVLKINPDYAKLVRRLDEYEYASLYESLANGEQEDPIKVNSDMFILDGHHRREILIKLGRQALIQIKQFKDLNSEREYVLESNTVRRQLNTIELCIIAEKNIPIYKQRAQERQTLGKNMTKVEEKGKVTDLVARKFGISGETFRQFHYVITFGTEELKQKLINPHPGAKRITINQAYRQCKLINEGSLADLDYYEDNVYATPNHSIYETKEKITDWIKAVPNGDNPLWEQKAEKAQKKLETAFTTIALSTYSIEQIDEKIKEIRLIHHPAYLKKHGLGEK